MDSISVAGYEEEESRTISSLPDFAEIFLFLQNIGPYMKLPGISLEDLVNFFRTGKSIHLCWW